MPGKLFVVGTPIGNLEDFSPRGIRALREADFIAAEDTRVTLKLLSRFEIKKEMLSYYEHNKLARGGDIIARLLAGENCALVSDAGMPAISDPGEDLVRMARENGIPVEAVPGPCAAVTALAVSGMPSGRFCFEGFLTTNKPGRKARLSELKSERRTMVFYEAPHKLIATLSDMLSVFGERRICLARELTKLHETVTVTTFSEALSYFEQSPPRGEFVLIVDGAPEDDTPECTLEDALIIAKNLISQGLSASAAAKEAAAKTGLKKGEIYRLLISERE